jgi:orotidine-5'-phosphate decarboxylase
MLSSISKILEKMVGNSLIHHLESNNLLYTHQYGFLPKKSTEHNLLHLTNFVAEALNEGMFSVGVFLDLKFHDIPNTVAKACAAASHLGVWMLNVHACGGLEMMQAAQEAINTSKNKPLLIAVTVLTSMNQASLNQVGITTDLPTHVLNLATLTQQAGLDGVVCSALEASMLRAQLGNDFCLVTPGIRPANASQDDQSRIVTPADALRNGSNYLVIGRPITQATDPLKMLESIHAQCVLK